MNAEDISENKINEVETIITNTFQFSTRASLKLRKATIKI
jgi:hypothetical protein